MKYAAFIFFLLVFSACQTVDQIKTEWDGKTYTDSWLGEDKFKHFSAGIMLVTLPSMEMRRFNVSHQDIVAVSLATSISVGLAKEFYDGEKPNNHFCYKDLSWDLLGTYLGFIILNGNYAR